MNLMPAECFKRRGINTTSKTVRASIQIGSAFRAQTAFYCRTEFMFLLINNNAIFVFSRICFVWLLAGLFESTLVCFTSPEGQQKFCPLKAPLCLLPLGVFEDNLLSQWWRGRQVVVKGAEHKRTSQTHTNSVSNTTDQGQGRMILYFAAFGAYCKSFGNVPCLCEYHHLSTGGLIRNSLMWWIVGSVFCLWQSVLVGVTTGKGTDVFTWVPHSVHVCKAHFATLTKWLVFRFGG